jgi:hypothetical protein
MSSVVDVRGVDFRLDLSRNECWLLYVWLGEKAPFLRNQLSVVRNGGSAAVSISTHEEGRQVLAALATGGADPAALTGGLRSLMTALDENGTKEACE